MELVSVAFWADEENIQASKIIQKLHNTSTQTAQNHIDMRFPKSETIAAMPICNRSSSKDGRPACRIIFCWKDRASSHDIVNVSPLKVSPYAYIYSIGVFVNQESTGHASTFSEAASWYMSHWSIDFSLGSVCLVPPEINLELSNFSCVIIACHSKHHTKTSTITGKHMTCLVQLLHTHFGGVTKQVKLLAQPGRQPG